MNFLKRMGNKGSMLDILLVVMAMMIFAMSILVSTKISDEVSGFFLGEFGSTEATTVYKTARQGFGIFDFLFMFMFFVLTLLPVLFAVMVKNNPIFFVLNFIVVLIYFLVAPALSNVMYEFWNAGDFAQYAAGGGGSFTYPIMTRTFQWLPYISLGISVILMVAQFGKSGEV